MFKGFKADAEKVEMASVRRIPAAILLLLLPPTATPARAAWSFDACKAALERALDAALTPDPVPDPALDTPHPTYAGKDLKVVASRAGEHGGQYHRVWIGARKEWKKRERFELGHLPYMVDNYPEWARILGITLRDGYLEYPDADEFGALAAKLREQGHPLAPAFLPRKAAGEGPMPLGEYLKGLSEGYFPVQEVGSLHFHDFWLHGIGYMSLPPALLPEIRKGLKALSLLFEGLPPGQTLPFELEVAARGVVDQLDTMTTAFPSRLLKRDERQRARSEQFMLQFLAKMTEARQALEKHRKLTDPASPFGKLLDEILAEFGDFGPYDRGNDADLERVGRLVREGLERFGAPDRRAAPLPDP